MPVTDSSPSEPQFVATLTRGNRYTLRDKVFERGIEVIVSAAERDHLEEHAVDVRLVPGFDPEFDTEEGRSEVVQKFTFRDHVEGERINAHLDPTTGRHPTDAAARAGQSSRHLGRVRALA